MDGIGQALGPLQGFRGPFVGFPMLACDREVTKGALVNRKDFLRLVKLVAQDSRPGERLDRVRRRKPFRRLERRCQRGLKPQLDLVAVRPGGKIV